MGTIPAGAESSDEERDVEDRGYAYDNRGYTVQNHQTIEFVDEDAVMGSQTMSVLQA